jgi:hypothetical protein
LFLGLLEVCIEVEMVVLTMRRSFAPWRTSAVVDVSVMIAVGCTVAVAVAVTVNEYK